MDNETVTVVALVKVKPGSEDAAPAAVTPVIEQTHQETGGSKHVLHRSATDPQEFVIVERWASQADPHQLPAAVHGPAVQRPGRPPRRTPGHPLPHPTPVGDSAKAAL